LFSIGQPRTLKSNENRANKIHTLRGNCVVQSYVKVCSSTRASTVSSAYFAIHWKQKVNERDSFFFPLCFFLYFFSLSFFSYQGNGDTQAASMNVTNDRMMSCQAI